jgi:hypothetical protein
MTQVPDPPQRVVAVITGPVPGLPEDLVAAMLSDVVDLVATTPQVASAVLATAGQLDVARVRRWFRCLTAPPSGSALPSYPGRMS